MCPTHAVSRRLGRLPLTLDGVFLPYLGCPVPPASHVAFCSPAPISKDSVRSHTTLHFQVLQHSNMTLLVK